MVVPLSGRAIIQSCQYHADRVNMGRPHTVGEVQPGSVPGKSDGADVDLLEMEPWKNNGSGYDALQPKSSVVFVSMLQVFAWLSVVVDKENNLDPDQSQSGPSEEAVSPLEGVVVQAAHTRVGEGNHHQKEAQDDP